VGFVCVTKASSVVPGDTIYAVGWGYTETSRNQGFFSIQKKVFAWKFFYLALIFLDTFSIAVSDAG